MYLAVCATALHGFSAAAATVIPYAGEVFVSRGNGFQKIDGTATVKVGDSVMVSPNGLAQVQLDDGNAITVSPGQVLSVPAKARAKDAALPDGANATQADPNDPSRIDRLIGAAALLAGGAAVAAALATSGGGDAPIIVPHPASP
jgi:hypothetical protein